MKKQVNQITIEKVAHWTQFQSLVFVFLFGMVSVFATGCGATTFESGNGPIASGNGGAGGSGGTGGGGGSGEPPIPFEPDLSFNYDLTGVTGSNPVWRSGTLPAVDTILKVRVKAESFGYVSVPTFGNYSVNPGCLQVRVGIKNASNPNAVPVSVTTPILRAEGGNGSTCEYWANYNNQQIKDEFVRDFSSAIVGQAGPWEIQIEAARYDYYCQIYPYYGYMLGPILNNCTLKNVYSNHLVGGTVEVQTNLDP